MMHGKGVLNMSWERKRVSKMNPDLIDDFICFRGLVWNGGRFMGEDYII